MSSVVARTGRHKQRYDNHLRLVSGCIPYKIENDVEDREDGFVGRRLTVLMISTPNRDDLVFPKGGWENDETVYEAAHREALEEAGVKGILSEKPLGVWEFRSKSKQNSCSNKGGCRGYMFAMEVTEELNSWPEQDSYKRKWLTTEEAFKFCRYDWMRDALRNFLTVLSANDTTSGRNEMIPELPIITAAETLVEHQMLSAICSSKPPPMTIHHLEESRAKCIVQG